ncbi:auxin-responsive protein SAUR71-like [Prosopis cineraria]|uniref:auxin-responsive protein SAUR71-like n=1 Tax=Prosopis cineraria TaxID=364024 RepID=UPI00240EB083|nr:auxin-responsive protein SAUR71-like [Prosopis cineraria]
MAAYKCPQTLPESSSIPHSPPDFSTETTFLTTMSPGSGTCIKIRHIVRVRQMLLRWRKKASATGSRSSSSDVTAGHVAVYVGARRRRFVVRTTYLNHPIFKKFLVEAEEEYGFCTQGPLTIPCDESLFEEALRAMSGYPTRFMSLDDLQKRCHVDAFSNFDFVGGESRPLLHDAPIC